MRIPCSSSAILSACICLLSLSLCAQTDNAEEPTGIPDVLTLQNAKKLALKGNPGIGALLARCEAADAIIAQAQAGYKPQLSADAGATWFHDVSLADGNDDNTPVYAAGVTASQLLYDGFATRFRVQAARAGSATAISEWRDGQRSLCLGVAQAFLGCLLARESGRIAQRDADFNRELLEEARKRFEAGAGPRVDTLNFSVRTRQAENTLLGTQKDQATARQILGALLGLENGTLPPHVTLVPVDGSVQEPEGSPDNMIELALGVRPDLIQLQTSIDQLDAVLGSVRAQYRPTVAGVAGFSLERADDLSFYRKNDATSFLGVQMTWNIFDGYRRRYSIAETNARILELTRVRNQLRIDIASEVRQDLEAVKTTARQFSNQSEIVELSSEIRDIVRKEYLSGLSPLTRLNEVQTDLVRAEGNHSLLRIQHIQACEKLAAATGTNIPD